MTATLRPAESDLDALASLANAEHHAFEVTQSAAIGHAIAAGVALIEAKALVGHGGWLAWLEANVEFTARTADRYMAIARNKTRVSDLDSVRGALAELAAPRRLAVRTGRDALLAHLRSLARVASSRAAIQALQGVLIEPDGSGAVTMRSTNSDVRMSVTLPADASAALDLGFRGAVLLPAELLVDAVAAMPQGVISIELPDSAAVLTSGTASVAIRTLYTDDSLPVPTTGEEGDRPVVVPAAPFVEGIERVAPAVARDETRPVLTGVVVSASESELLMVATDSYRLAVKETELETPLRGRFEVTVPAFALRELARLAGDVGEIAVSVGRHHVAFALGDVVLSSRRIDGLFPDYRRLLPWYGFEREVVIDRRRLIDAVHLARVVSEVRTARRDRPPLRLAFAPGWGQDRDPAAQARLLVGFVAGPGVEGRISWAAKKLQRD